MSRPISEHRGISERRLLVRPTLTRFFLKHRSEPIRGQASVDNLDGFTKTERSKMFITHWLYDDLRRTCYSVVELLNHYVKGTDRVWVLRRFTQDPIESLFGQIRNLNGSNTNLDRIGVDHGFSEIRSKCLKKLIMKQNN